MLAAAGKSAIEGLRARRLAFREVIGLRTRRQVILSLLTFIGEARIIPFCPSPSQENVSHLLGFAIFLCLLDLHAKESAGLPINLKHGL